MPPLTLEGDALGEKRRSFNKLVEDTIGNENYELRNISSDDSDIDNLLKIEIASRNRNVDYLIEVMKSNDMLYAATAIKKSTWLITEPQYANIINPEYLHTQLLPSMNTKTFNKLMLHIRLNLNDERRVEAFYEYLTATESAHKWLVNCSITFIEDVIKNKRLIPLSIFKRLCKKSAHFMTYYTRVAADPYKAKEEILFLLKSHTEDVFNLLEQDDGNNPSLGKKKTKLLLKKYSQKIFENFPKYMYKLETTEVVRYINKKEIKTFLCEQVKKDQGYSLCFFSTLKLFLNKIPEEERFDFVKKTFIDKTELVAFCPQYKPIDINWNIKLYEWYEFAPTEVALSELKNLLRKDKPPSERITTLSTLITGAGKNLQHIKSLLQFFRDNYIREHFKFKIQFINNLLSQISTHYFDVDTWKLLDQLFHSMDVYTESNNNVQLCLESIILYKVLHDEPIPEIVEKKVKFITFGNIRSKLNEEENKKLFTYLFNSVMRKVPRENMSDVSQLADSIIHINNALTLLRDWKRDISEFPYILEKIRNLVKIRQENKWQTDMSCLYNVKRSWRKHMFEESLSLCQTEEVCMNALKHKPQLLTQHDKEIDTLRTKGTVSLQRLLTKLRVYWPHSLAQHWIDTYLLHLNKPAGQKAVIKGLLVIFPQYQAIDLVKKYRPDDEKLNCRGKLSQEMTIRKNIAKHLHVARPIIPFDTVLWYAKGDYLKYTVSSLNAILSNMSVVASREHLPKLLDAPDSLRKFGLQLAAKKLEHRDHISIFLEIWNTSQDSSIRTALVKHTYTRIALMAHNPSVQKELWEILSSFIDALTAEESAEIYKIFGEVRNVPIAIRERFYMKSYEFLTSLPASANCETFVNDLIDYAPKIMDHLDEEFVANKMLSPAGPKFCAFESKLLEAFACYLLCGKSEEDQLLRFKKVLEPAMEEAFQLWDSTNSGQYYVRDNFKKFLSLLFFYCRVYYVTKEALPVRPFIEVKSKIEKELPLLDNYVLYTSCKLMTEYVKVMDDHKSVLNDIFDSGKLSKLNFSYKDIYDEVAIVWKDIHVKISPSLGLGIVNCLKEDIERYNNIPSIYHLFTEAFEKLCDELISTNDRRSGEYYYEHPHYILETAQHMLDDQSFDPSYFVVSEIVTKSYDLNDVRLGISMKMESHPSKAVRMHFYNDFRNYPRN